MRYKQWKTNKDGWTVWIQPKRTGHYIKCCDCGLVHKFKYRIYNKKHIQFKITRISK